MSYNSVTKTMVRGSAHLKSLLKPDVWPDPLDSIDLTIPVSRERQRTKLGNLVESYFWAIKGSALAAYTSIEDDIKSCLLCRDDLYEGETESGLPSSIDCYMFGSTPETSRPCIAVSCPSKGYCRKAINVIKESDWWVHFHKEYPAFKLVRLRNRPRPKRMANFTDGAILVYSSQPRNLWSGLPVPLYFCPSEAVVPTETDISHSTMGGIVFLNGKSYGLTIAHALRSDHATDTVVNDADDDWDTGSTFSIVDDSDNESECPSTHSMASAHAAALSPSSDIKGQCPDEVSTAKAGPTRTASTSLTLVGRLAERSNGSASDEADWALIEFNFQLGMADFKTRTGHEDEPVCRSRKE